MFRSSSEARTLAPRRVAKTPPQPPPKSQKNPQKNQPKKTQTFDAGLLGEGALHIAAAIHARGLASLGAVVLPRGAVLYAQPGRLSPLAGLAPASAAAPTPGNGIAPPLAQQLLGLSEKGSSGLAAAADPYTYRPGQYSAVDLEALGRRGAWMPAAPPQRTFGFSFADPEAAGDAAQAPGGEALLEFEVEGDAEVNAVAFFFALDMGGGEWLLSSAEAAVEGAGGADNRPAATVVASSWKQAVQRLEPVRCGNPGEGPLRVVAKHDTYGVTFEWAQAGAANEKWRPPAARELDEAVAAADAGLSAALARAVAQDPLAYRRLARAAVRLALAQEEGASAAGAVVARLLS